MSPTAIFCVTRNAVVAEASRAAWRLASEPDPAFRVSRGQLRLANDDENRRLRRAIFAACSADFLEDGLRGGDVAVHADDGRLDGVLTVTPYVSRNGPDRRMAALIWRPIGTGADAGLKDRLRRIFGLTGREAEMAAMLRSAPSLRAVGEALSISFNTARSHLQRIMEKTETHSQSELIRLITLIDS